MTAIGFIKRAQAEGLKVPQDISVIGYDDLMISSVVSPPLTTVRQPIIDMGREAFNIACGMINAPDKEATVKMFEPELIIRESA